MKDGRRTQTPTVTKQSKWQHHLFYAQGYQFLFSEVAMVKTDNMPPEPPKHKK